MICFTWCVYVIYMTSIYILLYSDIVIPKEMTGMLSSLSLVYLMVALAIWLYQFLYSKHFIKKHLLIKSQVTFNIKATHSVLIAINGWLIIIINLMKFTNKFELAVFYAIISSSTILFYPSLDMLEYISKEIKKFNKQKEKEKIENESNGSKNYTA